MIPRTSLPLGAVCRGRLSHLWLSAIAVFAVNVPAAKAQFDDVIDSPMYKLPDFPVPKYEYGFPDKLLELWLKVLSRPDAELKCQAAGAIALAQQRGMKGLEVAIAPLIAELEQADSKLTVRLAVSRALVALEAKMAAPSFLRQIESANWQLREVIEPALAKWDYKPARDVWLTRLKDPAAPSRRKILAMQCLVAVKEDKAADPLLDLSVNDQAPLAVRLEAARALGRLRAEGLEQIAGKLLGNKGTDHLLRQTQAVSMLKHHKSPVAIELLQTVLKAGDPTTVFLAASRLFEIDATLLRPSIKELLASTDAKVRTLGVEVLAKHPDKNNLSLLVASLDDAHVEVRRKARQLLLILAENKEYRNVIIPLVSKVMDTNQGRALEQATILLTQLDHKPVAMRLVELLRFERPEVKVTAAWALRKLDVEETLPGVATFIEEEYNRPPKAVDRSRDHILDRGDPYTFPGAPADHELSQLLQFIGNRKYAPADGLLRSFIPRRGTSWPESRSAAIWALGMLHEGKEQPPLALLLQERLNDTMSRPPEDGRVRRMSAVTLGRMRAKDALVSLKKYCAEQKPSNSAVANACGWAIELLTGEKMQPPEVIQRQYVDWFLVPRN